MLSLGWGCLAEEVTTVPSQAPSRAQLPHETQLGIGQYLQFRASMPVVSGLGLSLRSPRWLDPHLLSLTPPLLARQPLRGVASRGLACCPA